MTHVLGGVTIVVLSPECIENNSIGIFESITVEQDDSQIITPESVFRILLRDVIAHELTHVVQEWVISNSVDSYSACTIGVFTNDVTRLPKGYFDQFNLCLEAQASSFGYFYNKMKEAEEGVFGIVDKVYKYLEEYQFPHAYLQLYADYVYKYAILKFGDVDIAEYYGKIRTRVLIQLAGYLDTLDQDKISKLSGIFGDKDEIMKKLLGIFFDTDAAIGYSMYQTDAGPRLLKYIGALVKESDATKYRHPLNSGSDSDE